MAKPLTATPEVVARYRAAPMFSVSLGKLAVMSICTMGIYEWYWFLKQWDGERRRENQKLSPMIRALLAPFYAFSLFGRLRSALLALGARAAWPTITLAVAYLLLSLSWMFPLDSFSYISALSFVPLLFVQRSVNALNQTLLPELERNDKYSAAEIALAVTGVLLHVFFIWLMDQLGTWLTGQLGELRSILDGSI